MLGGEIRWVSLPSFCISLIRWFSLRELSAEFVMRRVLADFFVVFSEIGVAASWISYLRRFSMLVCYYFQ